MAILTTPATAATVTALIGRVRTAVGDTQASAAGQKYSNTDILRAIDDTIAEMTAEMYEDAGPFLEEENLTYTANARLVSLTGARIGSAIYKVEDIDNVLAPEFIDYVDALDLDKDDFQNGWTFIGNQIALRPIPTAAKTLRISYLRYYIPISGSAAPSTDQHSMSVNHEEVIVIGAAIRLQEIDDEVPPMRYRRYYGDASTPGLWKKFLVYALKFRGPAYIRDTRDFG